MNTKTPEEPKTYPPLSELIREHIAITKDEVPVLIEFMDYAQHMEQQLGFGKLAMEMGQSENAKLRALVQELVDALEGTKSNTHWWRAHPSEEWIADAMSDAKEAGFTPTTDEVR